MEDAQVSQQEGLVGIKAKANKDDQAEHLLPVLVSWLEDVEKHKEEVEAEDRTNTGENRTGVLPSVGELKALLELVGAASLISEEGAYSQLAVLYLPRTREGTRRVLEDVLHCALLEESRNQKPLDKSSLAKLAPVCIPYHTYLLLDKSSPQEGSPEARFYCWGIADFSTHLAPKTPEKDPGQEDRTENLRFPQLDIALEPNALWLHSLHPGHVEGGWRDKIIHLGSSAPDFVLWNVPAIQKRAQTWSEDEKWQGAMCHCYRQFLFTFLLEHIIGMMVMRGAGGTLLLVLNSPSDSPTEKYAPEKFDLKEDVRHYRTGLDGNLSLYDKTVNCIEEFLDERVARGLGPEDYSREESRHLLFPFQPRTQLPHHLRVLCAFVANLTVVDGATVLDDHLNVLGFGEKIVADSSSSNNHLTDAARDFRARHGNRHQSAMDWVAAGCKDSLDRVAVVVSSDRKATVIFWNEKRSKVSVESPVVYRRT